MADDYAILPARPAFEEAEGTLAVRELQPLAALDATPDDLSKIADSMALNPVYTMDITPVTGEALAYRTGAVGAKDLSILRAEAERAAVQPQNFIPSMTSSTWLWRKELAEVRRGRTARPSSRARTKARHNLKRVNR